MSKVNPLTRQETIRNNNVLNLEEINLNALEKEVREKGVGNRGSPTFSLSESLENLPVRQRWRMNPLFKVRSKTLGKKRKGGKRSCTRKSRRYGKK